MNKYFLVGFALMLFGLNIGLRTGDWFGPKKVQIVRIKPKKQKPIIKVVKVEVPAPPQACIEPAPRKWVKRAVSSVGKARKTAAVAPATAALPGAVVPPTATPASSSVLPEVISVDRKDGSNIVSQTMKVGDPNAGQSLSAPVIKSIQTEE
jgi:hypothetical protein